MKKYILILLAFISSISSYCQNHNKFLGIEIKGSKSAFEQQLISKGFKKSSDGFMKGTFFGEKVSLDIDCTELSKQVYSVRVIFEENDDYLFKKLIFNLEQKYGKANKNTEDLRAYNCSDLYSFGEIGPYKKAPTLFRYYDYIVLVYSDYDNLMLQLKEMQEKIKKEREDL